MTDPATALPPVWLCSLLDRWFDCDFEEASRAKIRLVPAFHPKYVVSSTIEQ